MSQPPASTSQAHPASAGAATPEAKPKPRDKAHDAALSLALLLTDWLHNDRHHQAKLMELALGLLDDLGEEGVEAKERLTAVHEPPKTTAKAA
jgi:hypothetical protein